MILIDCDFQFFSPTIHFLKWKVNLTKTLPTLPPPPVLFVLRPLRLKLMDFDKFNRCGPLKLRERDRKTPRKVEGSKDSGGNLGKAKMSSRLTVPHWGPIWGHRLVPQHRGAKVSKPQPNHAYRPNQFSGQIPNFRNLLRGFDRHKEHHLKSYARTGICKILPFYRNMGPNIWCAKGLDWPEIGLHAKGLDEISGVLFVI